MVLDLDGVAELVSEAHAELPLPPCRDCGFTPMDYCRTCGVYYVIHEPACRLHVTEHHGHCCVLVPFVETCWLRCTW